MCAWLRRLAVPALLCAMFFCPGTALAQYDPDIPEASNYGGVGLLDTRTARFFPDGSLSISASFNNPDDRYAMTFQAFPWAEFTFRYAVNTSVKTYDRSFDVKLRLNEEGEYVPQFALGLQDILGTGIFSSEYLVGSKSWGPLDFSLGLGWGRLASRGTFQNPFIIFSDRFKTRPIDFGRGGVPLFNTYFRGPDLGLFGGISYETPIRNLTLKLEYSSDAYVREKSQTGADYDFPVNVGLTYQAMESVDVSLSLMHGRDIGLQISVVLDPTRDNWPVRLDPAPRFRARPDGSTIIPANQPASRPANAATGTVETRFVDLTTPQAPAPTIPPPIVPPTQQTIATDAAPEAPAISDEIVSPPPQAPADAAPPAIAGPLPVPQAAPEPAPAADAAGLDMIQAAIEAQRVTVVGLQASADTINVLIENTRYRRDSEAIARTARVLSAIAPPSIAYFEITTMARGQPLTRVTLPREQIDGLARFEVTPDELAYTSTVVPAPLDAGERVNKIMFPSLDTALYPVFRQSLFDPDNPIYVELGVGASASLRLTRGLYVEGAVTASLYNDFDKIKRVSNSVLPHVRSDIAEYLKQGQYRIESLASSYFFKLAPEVYGRVTAGYLERMYAGAGGEVLYRPFGQRWALGADLWSVRIREFDILFGLRNYQAITGHLTAYYDMPWYDLQFAVSAGQYLAGDRGVTFQVSRRFSTGIEVGAWFTLTNVSADRFGEGSFDKGIRVYIPFEWVAPFATRSGYNLDLRPIQRDGGQMLSGNRLLYDMTTSSDYGQITQQWNRVFK